MKNILTIVFLGSFGITNLLCQNFTFKSENPFGIKTIKDDDSRPTQKVMFFDYDGDGDLDILHSGIASLDNVETLNGLMSIIFWKYRRILGMPTIHNLVRDNRYLKISLFQKVIFFHAPGI
ncbi:MAG: hypothetical protein IPL13_08380 [Saprospiraceae bacterium]|nr:hypothetical protein [Candidatus Brachybacter algidus]